MATIKDVAKAAGVSTATVSYVLNNTAPISEETRQRVMDAVSRLGYRPNITARNLRASESRIIGYAWHASDDHQQHNYILSSFIHHMATTAERHQYHLMTFTHKINNTLGVYADLIETGRVDGFVVSDTNRNDERIRYLMDMQFPFVAFGRANPEWEFPFVDIDGIDGMRQVAAHLLDRGHTRIAFIGWPEGSVAGDFRFEGFRAPLAAAGCFDPTLIQRGNDGVEIGRRLAVPLLELPASRRPTAIAAVSDMLAIGATQAITAAGLQVGRDIAITGFDNVPLAEHLSPSLTSVRQPIDRVAQTLVQILLDILQGAPGGETHVLIKPELVIRDSSS
jgi:DNA-binding LacI/PurR family transcriptional regulator